MTSVLKHALRYITWALCATIVSCHWHIRAAYSTPILLSDLFFKLLFRSSYRTLFVLSTRRFNLGVRFNKIWFWAESEVEFLLCWACIVFLVLLEWGIVKTDWIVRKLCREIISGVKIWSEYKRKRLSMRIEVCLERKKTNRRLRTRWKEEERDTIKDNMRNNIRSSDEFLQSFIVDGKIQGNCVCLLLVCLDVYYIYVVKFYR